MISFFKTFFQSFFDVFKVKFDLSIFSLFTCVGKSVNDIKVPKSKGKTFK